MAYEANKFKPLQDEDKMPTGKWKGTKMIDVPATYFMYLWDNQMANAQVKNYIQRNHEVILKQAKEDGYGSRD